MSESQALTKIEPMPIESVDRHAGPLDMEPAAFRAGLDRRKENRKALMDWIRAALVENVDFGRIDTKRGKSKPSLFKPGAEKICGMLGIISTFPTLGEYEQCALKGIEIKSVVLRCALLDSRGVIVAEGVGARSLAQDYGDLNKALKMAEKSAHIDATLRMAGLSEVFTQDLEDLPPRANIEPERKASVPQGTSTPPKPTAKPPAPAQASEEQRLRWVAELKKRGEYALGYCYDKGWLLPPSGPEGDMTPGEPIETLDLRHVPTTKRQAAELLAELDSLLPVDQARELQDDGDLGPQKQPEDAADEAAMAEAEAAEAEQEDGVETVTGKLEAVSEKSGTSKQGKWTRYGLKVGDLWIGTFDKVLGELAKKDKNHAVRVQFRRDDKGCNLVSIERPGKP